MHPKKARTYTDQARGFWQRPAGRVWIAAASGSGKVSHAQLPCPQKNVQREIALIPAQGLGLAGAIRVRLKLKWACLLNVLKGDQSRSKPFKMAGRQHSLASQHTG